MNAKTPSTRTLASAAAILGTVLIAGAHAQTITVGADQVGGLTNVTSSTVAKVVSQNTPMTARTRVYGSGAEAWLPDLDAGRLDLGTHFAATVWLAHNKIDSNLELKNLRLIRSTAGTLLLGFVVKADSDVQRVSQLKGKRVAGSYPGQPIMRRLAGGVMEAHGIGWNDVTMIPVVAAVEGARAFQDGRVDSAWFAIATPLTREIHTKAPIRFLDLDMTPERLKLAHEKIFPGVVATRFQGDLPWAKRGTQLLTYELYVLASSHTKDDVVAAAVKAMWESDPEMVKAHISMGGFTNAAAVTDRPVIPYHPAAIAFYKEKGVWTAAAQAAHDALLAKATAR
jgi:hypothetical protein